MTETRPGVRRITESALIRRAAEALARFGTLEAGPRDRCRPGRRPAPVAIRRAGSAAVISADAG